VRRGKPPLLKSNSSSFRRIIDSKKPDHHGHHGDSIASWWRGPRIQDVRTSCLRLVKRTRSRRMRDSEGAVRQTAYFVLNSARHDPPLQISKRRCPVKKTKTWGHGFLHTPHPRHLNCGMPRYILEVKAEALKVDYLLEVRRISPKGEKKTAFGKSLWIDPHDEPRKKERKKERIHKPSPSGCSSSTRGRLRTRRYMEVNHSNKH
jgi:hypothetical protein